MFRNSFARRALPPALVAALLLFAAPLHAQTGKLTGLVTDSATGQPVAGVQIVLSRTGYGALTGSNGRYFVLAVPPGTYTVTARRIGYGSQQTLVQVGIDATREVNFVLATSASTLTGVRIVETATPLVERNATGTTAQITAEELTSLPVRSIAEALQLQPGFTEIPSISSDLVSFTASRRNDVSPLLIRGGRGGETGFLIDDVPVNNFLFGNQTIDVSVMALAGSQLIQGFMAPQYGNALSGIVSMATREGGTTLDGAVRYETSRLGGAVGSRQDELRGYDFIEGFLSGPVPATQEKLRFVMAGRTSGQARQVLEFDDKVYNPFEADTADRFTYTDDLVAGWRALGYNTSRDLFGKMTYYFTPQAKLSAAYIGYAQTSQGLPFDWQLTGYSSALACTEAYSGRYSKSVNVEDVCDTFYSRDRITPEGRPTGSEREAYIRPAAPTRLRDLYTLRYEQTAGRVNYRLVGGFLDQRRETCSTFFSGVCLGDRIADTNFNNRFVTAGVTSTALTPTEGTDRIAGTDEMRTALTRGDLQWQATDHHNISLGVFFQRHDLAFHETQDVGLNNIELQYVNYAAKPWDGAAYLQDRIEYDFLQITLGARFEYARADGIFFNDPIDPTNGTTQRTVCENPTRFGLPADFATFTNDSGRVITGFQACQAPGSPLGDSATRVAFRDDMGEAPVRTSFSPRVGFSFPITERSNAFFNFGIYVQNPLYNNLYQSTGIGTSVEGTPAAPQFRANSFVGNPRLESERTAAYEIGYNGEIGRNFAMQAVAFTKDQSGLTGVRTGGYLAGTDTRIQDPGLTYGQTTPDYTILVNQDFQTVRGLQLVMRRRVANYWGLDVNYGYMQVKTNAAPPDVEQQRTTEEGDIPARVEIRADQDQRHSASAIFRLQVGARTPQFRFGNLLANSGLSVTGRFISGFPYTPALTFGGGTDDRLERNSGTGPASFFVNLEARKAWDVSNLRYSTFVRVTNLLDRKNCAQVYATTGNCNGGTSPQARLASGNATGEGEGSTFFDRPQYLYDRRFVNAGVRVDF